MKDKSGNNPLHRAIIKGEVETVAVLLDLGADPKASNNNGLSPLRQARDQPEMERLLRDKISATR